MLIKRTPYRGKRVLRRSWPRRSVAVAAAALCLLAVVCGRTYSYFSAKDKVVNRLDLSELDFVIEEPSWEEPDTPVRPGDVLTKDPQIVNTGETDFVVRVKIQEVWVPKDPASTLQQLINPDYVRYFAADTGGEGEGGAFPAQQLLSILQADGQLDEGVKNFALRLDLTPNKTNPNTTYWAQDGTAGWYRGSTQNSEWLYYNQIVPADGGRTAPMFQAVTIRTAEDVWPLDAITLAPGEDLTQAHAEQLAEYNKLLTQYDLELYVYAETVQADSFAWQDAWGTDLPQDWEDSWGGASP